MKHVEIGRVSGQTTGVFLADGETIATALERAGIELQPKEEISIDGNKVATTYEPADGDYIVITQQVKGNIIR
jgi:type IV secretory pathway VirB9-like protein